MCRTSNSCAILQIVQTPLCFRTALKICGLISIYISTSSRFSPGLNFLLSMSDLDSLIHALYQTQSLVYLTVATGAAVVYDQVLNLSQEVDYIWNRRWSPTTALYLLARYAGSVSVVGNIALIVRLNWSLTVAMQAILLMRVFALCGRSKAVLVFLSACFFCQTAVVIALLAKQLDFSFLGKSILLIGPAIGSVEQEIDMDYHIFGPLPAVQTSVQLAFDIILFAFALFAFSRHALEARALAGGWSVNPLVKLLTADQTLYFLCYALWQALTIPETLPSYSTTQSENLDIAINILFSLIVIFGPRMVIRLRAEELRSREGTFEEELSTIQFGPGNPLALSSVTGEGEGEPETALGGNGLENRSGIVEREVC
ncbi:hypothetical protein BV22DRAFT_386168 [Leucogyrophana mollusca]|uniref:Uncharacterized protein n=1 Tax=Leucogyrophana mollusca TaxID=85980 RepID=A0ACB8BK49_9AGAM|nr:hypothetical protein BV22DRAFT_386168 [Leucogyrophana mollusca]